MKVWVPYARSVQVAFFTLHHTGCTLVSPSMWAKRVPRVANVLTKVAYEGRRVVLRTPDWGCSGEYANSRRLLDGMTVATVPFPDTPIYVSEDSDTAMQAPEWSSFQSIVDGSLNPVPVCDVDQVLLKQVMAQTRGLTLSDLKIRIPGAHFSHTYML